jgi:hypothetical protein
MDLMELATHTTFSLPRRSFSNQLAIDGADLHIYHSIPGRIADEGNADLPPRMNG